MIPTASADLPELVPIAGRTCGECTMCCKLPAIPELNKKGGEWCTHCSTRKRCDSYDTRPDSCRRFYCHFMLSDVLDEAWRPSNARFMIMSKITNGQKIAMIVVDPPRPDAWRREPYYSTFKLWAEKVRVVVNIGRRQIEIFPTHENDLGEMPEEMAP